MLWWCKAGGGVVGGAAAGGGLRCWFVLPGVFMAIKTYNICYAYNRGGQRGSQSVFAFLCVPTRNLRLILK